MYQIKNYLHRGFSILKNEGVQILLQRIGDGLKRLFGMPYLGQFDRGYSQWRKRFDLPLGHAQSQQLIEQLEYLPLISIIVPVYNVETRWLSAAIDSVKSQSYPHWQLCLVDDCSSRSELVLYLRQLGQSDDRIKIQANPKNSGIALTSNKALAMAEGEFVALMDHDDMLREDALLQNVRYMNNHPQIDVIYSDEDKVSVAGEYRTPFFKPDYSPELLYSHNYIGHLVVIRKSLLDEVGGFRQGYDGAQDYDLLLRVCEKTDRIGHLAKVLYHWREIPQSTASTFNAKSYAWQAGQLALEQAQTRTNSEFRIEKGIHPGTYQTVFATGLEPSNQPRISILIPFKDKPELLNQCLQSLFNHAQWENLEIIAIDNNSCEGQTARLLKDWTARDSRIQVHPYHHAFNYSAICNFGANLAQGDYLVLMNNDVQIIDDHWVAALLQHAQKPGVGAVGAKLLYPDHSIQHAGIVVGINGGAGHGFKRFPKGHKGYFMRLDLTHNVSAVTGALMMVSRQKYFEAGGLDETAFSVAYNDVDFCLSLIRLGYRNVWTPQCRGIHYESSSRGKDEAGEKRSRHQQEKLALATKWAEYLDQGDPYYNPNLTLQREDYSLTQSQRR